MSEGSLCFCNNCLFFLFKVNFGLLMVEEIFIHFDGVEGFCYLQLRFCFFHEKPGLAIFKLKLVMIYFHAFNFVEELRRIGSESGGHVGCGLVVNSWD